MNKRCFEQDCEIEVQYACKCSFPKTYSCEMHLEKHLKLGNRTHNFNSVFLKASKGTNGLPHRFLPKAKLGNEKSIKKKDSSPSNLKKRKLDSDLTTVSIDFKKISQSQMRSEPEKAEILLALHPESTFKDFPSPKTQKPNTLNSDSIENPNKNIKKFKQAKIYAIQNEIDQLNLQESKSASPILLSKNLDSEDMQDFRRSSLLHDNEIHTFMPQDYKENLKLKNQFTSLYIIDRIDETSNLFVYDTESGIEHVKLLETPIPLDSGTCIAQLPNDELFCFGGLSPLGIAFIIDRNSKIRVLPSKEPYYASSAIYFNRAIYCFGGMDQYGLDTSLSEKFDLENNRWIKLSWIPEWDSGCSSIIFNGTIIISGYVSKNLLIYSVDINSFSEIAHNFAKSTRKMLINAERLYLIECGKNGKIYESGIGCEYEWNRIAKTIISGKYPVQVYCSYNNEGIYIATSLRERYYKFNISKKRMYKLK